MKPNYALSLSFDGIALLRRAQEGWYVLGEVAIDSADLSADLASLRAKAFGAGDECFATKLIIPPEQIKFLKIAASEPLEAAITAALDGATPYPVSDLVYDWAMSGEQLVIAAVAQETLDEAETFALGNGFAPVGFVADPGTLGFGREIFFGQSRCAPTFLNGDFLEPDAAPIFIIPTLKPDEMRLTSGGEDASPVFHAGLSQADSDGQKTGTGTRNADSALSTPQTPRPADLGFDDVDETTRSADVTDINRAAEFPSISRASRDLPPDVPASKPDSTAQISVEQTAPCISNERSEDTKSGNEDFVSDHLRTTRTKLQEPEPTPPVATQSVGFTPPAPSAASLRKPVAQSEQHEWERERSSLFGIREGETNRVRRPMSGIVLALLLMLFLSTIAAMATLLSEDGIAGLFGHNDEPEALALLPEVQTAPVVPSNPDTETGFIEAQPEPAEVITPTDHPPQNPTQIDDTAESHTVLLSFEDVEAHYAVTGVWQAAPNAPTPPGEIRLSNLYLTSVDTEIQAHYAAALPTAGLPRPDVSMAPLAAPPPAGTRFALDPRGLVIATAQGAWSPNGVLVFRGQPEAVPPADIVRPVLEASSDIERPISPGARPRPSDLSESNQQSTSAELTRREVAAFRPQLRPETTEVDEQRDETSTDLAVPVSLLPKGRPKDFERAVATAREDSPVTASLPSETVQPSIPSSANVAQQATERNQLNLRRVNLIGVFGQPSDRRALVRLANGRYKKVQVGDRVDGGRVAAIGETELRYVKGGRSMTLKMPRS